MKKTLQNLLTTSLLLLISFFTFAQAPPLGTAASFALFTSAGAFSNTGGTLVTGDIGTNVGAFTGFPPGIVIGQIHVADGASAQAAADVEIAYSSLSTVPCGIVLGTTLGNGQVLGPNVYCLGAASTLNGDLTLDGQGDPDALFIFKIDGAFASTTLSRIILINLASVCNIYFQINGQVDLGVSSVFKGNILANGAINLLENATLDGRGLSRAGAISLQNNTVTRSGSPAASVLTASGSTTFCAGGSVIISGNVGGTFNNGATTGSITVTTSGNFFVTNANGCGTVVSNQITVTVNPLPVCAITGNGAICTGQSTQLCAPEGNFSYLWNTGAITRCITVSTAGTYSVTITDANGCKSTCTKTVTVTSQSSCTITGNGSICQGGSTQLCVPFSATSSYLWSTGATTNCITVTSAGTYSVTITNPNGCTSTCSKTVTVSQQASPPCVITGDNTICQGQTTQLCAPAGYNYTYLWNTGATTRCITVNCSGIFTVTVTNPNGCTSTCSITVTVSLAPPPVCTITGSGSFCQGLSSQLCAPEGPGYTYLWNTGATSRCITVTIAGTYSVTVTNAAGCSSTCSKTVSSSQEAPPVCTISGSSTICPGQPTELCAPYGYNYTYLWSTGATSRCITVTTAGTYTLTITNANGCKTTCSKTIAVSTTALSCSITGNTTICPGGFTTLCATAGNGYTYLWSNGATTRCITATVAGNYTVTITSPSGCTSSCSKTVSVSSTALTCTISGNNTICPGGSTILCAATGTGYKYLWNTGATTACITVTAPGTYSVTVTNSTGCSSTCTKTITSVPLTCNITSSGSLCPGGTVSLCAPGGTGYTYLWSTGATTRCITVSTPGNYTVTYSNGSGCSGTCTKTVTATPAPSSTITGSATFCPGGFTSLCAPSGTGYTYMWSTGATTRCINVVAAGTYSVTVTKNGCSSTSTKTVTTTGCPTTCSVCVPGISKTESTGQSITAPVIAEEQIIDNAYPNPFTSKTVIEFQSNAVNAHVTVELYNAKGNQVSTLFNSNVKKGLYKVEVNAGNLTPGIYYYRITTGDQIINRKLMLLR